MSVPPKAYALDMPERFREIISDPLNILIKRHPLAGTVDNGVVTLHCGTKVCLEGDMSYYQDFSKVLIYNRGVHEPVEEYVFQCLIPHLSESPKMLELGSYWAHYSMWLKSVKRNAMVTMVEPEDRAMEVGKHNFRLNGFEGEFIQAFVGSGQFEVDGYLSGAKLDILHADIQGYEVQMLEGAKQSLQSKLVDYVFVSTHSQAIHEQVCCALRDFGYRLEVDVDFDNDTTSHDGFVFASSPLVKQVCNFNPMGRNEIAISQVNDILKYLNTTNK
jgi:hypothetical protein